MKRIFLFLFFCGLILWEIPCRADWGNNIGFQGLKYSAISSATTTVVKSAFCYIHTLTVTGGTAGTITLYGNVAASSPTVATWSSTNAPNSYLLDVNLASGCTVVTGGNTNITVSYL